VSPRAFPGAPSLRIHLCHALSQPGSAVCEITFNANESSTPMHPGLDTGRSAHAGLANGRTTTPDGSGAASAHFHYPRLPERRLFWARLYL